VDREAADLAVVGCVDEQRTIRLRDVLVLHLLAESRAGGVGVCEAGLVSTTVEI